MMNPHLYEPTYKRVNSNDFAGGKFYQPIIGIATRREFRRASEAETYAVKVHVRWCRLYDALIVDMIAPPREPAK